MPFVNEEELKNKNKLVKDYINNPKAFETKTAKRNCSQTTTAKVCL